MGFSQAVLHVSPSFKLRDPNADGQTGIRLVMYYDRKRFVHTTPYKIYPELWDADQGRAIVDRRKLKPYVVAGLGSMDDVLADMHDINAHLDKLRGDMVQFFRNPDNRTITADQLRARLRADTLGGTRSKLFLEVFDEWLDGAMAGEIPHERGKGGPYNTSTLKYYRSTRRILDQYPGAKSWTCDDVIGSVMTRLVQHMHRGTLKGTKPLHKGQGNQPLTIERRMATIKVVLNWAVKQGWCNQTTYRDYKIPTYHKVTHALTQSEVAKIEAYEPPAEVRNPDNRIRCRDLFMLMYYTAQRFSDAAALTTYNIEGDRLVFVQQKTGTNMNIRLHPTARAILEKYDGEDIWKISERRYNLIIKDIARECGLDREAHTLLDEKNNPTAFRPMHELVSSHYGRKSAATHMVKHHGVPMRQVQSILGHSTIRITEMYLDISEKDLGFFDNEFFSA